MCVHIIHNIYNNAMYITDLFLRKSHGNARGILLVVAIHHPSYGSAPVPLPHGPSLLSKHGKNSFAPVPSILRSLIFLPRA